MIPSTAHFIWIGRTLPWVYVLAIKSAVLKGGFEKVVLHHADSLDHTPWWSELVELPRFESRRIDPTELLRPLGADLRQLYTRLDTHRARVNILRTAILYTEGGVYLDTDTVTIRSLASLCDAAAFVGVERLAWPTQSQWWNPWFVAQVLFREAARDLLRRVPHGWKLFRKIEPLYLLAANNAVMGAAPGHALMGTLLERMPQVPAERQLKPFALGTNLLKRVLSECSFPDLVVHPAEVFYPLPPEICEHWFALRGSAALDDVLHPATRVVHWYASVRTKQIVPQLTPDYIRKHSARQLFSALAASLETIESVPSARASHAA